MAKIVEEVIVVKVSKLTRDNDKTGSILPAEFVPGLEAMASEILGDAAVLIEVLPLADYAGDTSSSEDEA
jgi:hypothetical protein